jgi:hypothetical protein
MESSMSKPNSGLVPRTAFTRLLCGAAAGVCAVGSLAGLLMLFQHASDDPWLQPSPALLAARARCDTLPQRPAREQCAHQVIEQALAADRGAGQVAQR